MKTLRWELLLIPDRRLFPAGPRFEEIVRLALATWGGSRCAIWLREKDAAPADQIRIGTTLRRLCDEGGSTLVVSDRIDVAEAVGADGVQLSEAGPAVSEIRSRAPRLAVGRSVHDRLGVAGAQDADWLVLAPVQDVPGKEALGWDRWRSLASTSVVPVVALGGLGIADLPLARSHGAAAIGVRRALQAFVLAAGPAMVLLSACSTPTTGPEADDDTADDDSAEPTPTPVPLPVPKDPASTCTGLEPDDAPLPRESLSLPDPPWPGATTCVVVPKAPIPILVSGHIASVVAGSWDGDTDTYLLEFSGEARFRAVLQWTPLQGDYDAVIRCWTEAAWTDPWDGALAHTYLPEVGESDGPVSGPCWLFVSGYAGAVADYVFWLESLPGG